MEAEAFERARAFDTETIIRQNRVIGDQMREIDRLQERLKALADELELCEDICREQAKKS